MTGNSHGLEKLHWTNVYVHIKEITYGSSNLKKAAHLISWECMDFESDGLGLLGLHVNLDKILNLPKLCSLLIKTNCFN